MQLAGFALLGILQFDFDNHGGADLGVIIAFGVMVAFVVRLYNKPNIFASPVHRNFQL